MSRKPAPQKLVRCAIYTRKSSEEGLDQAFNSLHAQREACEAYVKSQAAEGWRVLPGHYDDGGFSGGNLQRPALERLLADISSGRVDIIVVYKIDRLTRSLADFAKIVERLDAVGASFVSVTQAFNTTTSMGRLTLNVLLSFAQFEREVTGERIRDKIAASKAKGMWMGGPLPLGYDAPVDPLTRALVVNPAEAETVRQIFALYLELGSVHALEARLDADGVRSKLRVTKAGRSVGGLRFSRGALFHLLKNRIYLGEIPHRDQTYAGSHPAIVEPDVFDQVQAMIRSHARKHRERPLRAATMPLKGRLFDAEGSPMSPTFTHGKRGQVYRYYVSSTLQCGRGPDQDDGAIRRVPARELEGLLADYLGPRLQGGKGQTLDQLLSDVVRVEVLSEAVRITLPSAKLLASARAEAICDPADPARSVLTLAIRCRLRGGRSWIETPPGVSPHRRRERDPTLIKGLRQAHRLAARLGWRASDGSVAAAEGTALGSAYERNLCRLAFLAPDIQAAILQGRQPRVLTLQSLVQNVIPSSWAEQRAAFGFDVIEPATGP